MVGLGYAGLPLAVASAEAGFRTVGIDVDPQRCATLNRGVSPVGDVSSARVAGTVTAGRFEARTDVERPLPDVVLICVPTPFTSAPDLTYVRSATEAVAARLRTGTLVILQSTSFPGTTREVVEPILQTSGLRAGVDFALAFSPERVDPGNGTWDLHNTPKIVGGLTPRCTDRAAAVLGTIVGDATLVHRVASPEIAEMAKLLENTYRMINIGLVNELAMLAHELGIDFGEVIKAAATKPFGFTAFRPGVGPGGECIPVDPLYLAWKARDVEASCRFIDLADEVNRGMARYVVDRLAESLAHRGDALAGRRVLCLGASYKGGVADTRNSRALRVMELLARTGALVSYSDPLVPVIDVAGQPILSTSLTADPTSFDLVVVLVDGVAWPLKNFSEAGIPVFLAYTPTAEADVDDVEHL